MEDPRWLRLITIGLVLAALAVGYFLLSGRLASNSVKKTQASPTSVLGQNTQPTPTAIPTVVSTPSPVPSVVPNSAYNRIVNRTQGGVQTLPSTGFPVGLFGALSAAAAVAGWGLRRFPH